MKMVKIVPILIGSLGIISEGTKWNVKEIGIECPIELLQNVCLLGIVTITKKVLYTIKRTKYMVR